MLTRLKGGASLALLALACTLVAASAGSAGNRIQPATDSGLFTPAWTPLGVSNAQTTVMLQLAGDPVTVADADAAGALSSTDKAALQKQLKSNQDAIKGSIAKLGGTVLGDYQLAYNGIKVRIAREQAVSARGACPASSPSARCKR